MRHITDTGVITGVSVAHTRASVDEIDAAGGESVRAVVSDLLARENVEEAFALSTCNRAEAYVVTDRTADGASALETFAPDVRDRAVRQLDHEESLRHLMRVAAGLESLVLGEDQIIGQLKESYETARDAGGIGPVMEDAVTKAIHVGERARNETGINEGVVSLGSAAVRLADREIGLDGASALVVGAGEMGTLAARALDAAGVTEVIVANRTVSSAEHVAGEIDTDAEAIPLGELVGVVPNVDLLISATGSPEPVVGRGDVVAADELVCIDIAQPRDVAPAVDELDGVTLFDIDALESVTDETRMQRREAAERVETIIDDELDRLLDAMKRRRADDAVSAMYESAERVKARELEEAYAKLEAQGGLTDDQRETVAGLADALVGQLLAAPTKSLRQAAGEDDWNTIRTALRLFDPEFDEPPATPDGDTSSGSGAGSSTSRPGVTEQSQD